MSLAIVRCSNSKPGGSPTAIRNRSRASMSHPDAAPKTVAGLPGFAGERHGGRRAVRVKRDGSWQDRSYAEVSEEIERLATGLIAHGIEPGDRVCILADTRPEWTGASYALLSAGAVVVPIYPTNSPEECEWVVGNSGAVAVLVEDAAQLAKIDAVRERLPALRMIFVVESRDAAAGVLALDEVAASGGDREELSRRRQAVTPDDLAYLHLPLAHVFAQPAQLAAFQVGAAIAYYGGDTKQIVPEIMEVQPDYLPSVP